MKRSRTSSTCPLHLRSQTAYSQLECRRLLASVSLNGATGLLLIVGDNGADSVMVSSNGSQIAVDDGTSTTSFATGDVSRVSFDGLDGDDVFVSTVALPTVAHGRAGNDFLSTVGGDDVLTGGGGADVISTTAGTNHIAGGKGNDQIQGGSNSDFVNAGDGDDIVNGGGGNDLLGGGNGNDQIDGEAGNDRIRGFFGNDTLHGGVGNDKLFGQQDNDTLYGDDDQDTLRGHIGDDELHGGNGDDFVLGEAGNDELYGDDGGDSILGHDGDDELHGGNGNDFLLGQDGADIIYGDADVDVVHGGEGNDTIEGGVGNDQLYGNLGDDSVDGGSGDDLVHGGGGNDLLVGSDGDDVIVGATGDDLLRGGNDNDILTGGSGFDSLFGGSHTDLDSLNGGYDADRFLSQGADLVEDRSEDDAVILFENVDSQWSDREIEVLDEGFAALQERTQSTVLLQDSLPSGDLTFYKYDDLGPAAAINYLSYQITTTYNGQEWVQEITYQREIHFTDWNENSDYLNEAYASVAIHELGHNWDSVMELTEHDPALQGIWDQFLNLSDWQESNPGSGYTQSNDGQWWYSNDAGFAENYGRTNPNEDLATVWEYYFSGQSTTNASLQAKLDLIDMFLDLV